MMNRYVRPGSEARDRIGDLIEVGRPVLPAQSRRLNRWTVSKPRSSPNQMIGVGFLSRDLALEVRKPCSRSL